MYRAHEYDDRDYPTANKAGLPDLSGATENHNETHEEKVQADRLMAVLEVVRRHEISVDVAARLAGVSREEMIHLLRKLSIPFEQ